MNFLDMFTPEHRNLFEGAAAILDLKKGKFLLRRGEPGGDIYLLRAGKLEVVDSRRTPEVILAVLAEGAVVGEMSFIDNLPRSADVRIAEDAEVLHWNKDDLRSLLDREPRLGSAFFQTVAKIAGQRMRNVQNTAMAGGLGSQKSLNVAGAARLKEEVAKITEDAKEGFLDLETRLRQDPNNTHAQASLRQLLDQLQEEIRQLFSGHTGVEASTYASRVLCRELHPYFVRSALAERCIRRPQGVGGTAEILAHILVDTSAGDGTLGELIDRWLLDRPVANALRQVRQPTIDLLASLLPTDRNRRALLLPAGTGSLVAGVTPKLVHPPTVLTVVDQSRDALAFLDAGITWRPKAVELQTVQENLAQFAISRFRHTFPSQDAIILNGLLEYMPDRIAVSMLTVCRQLLTENGIIMVTALSPSLDQMLLDRLLMWPTIRRTREGLRRVFQAAGLEITHQADVEEPALLFVGSPNQPVTSGVVESAGLAMSGAVE